MAQNYKYQIAHGETHLDEILSGIAKSKKAHLADIQQYDIIYTVGLLKTLIKVELGKDTVRVFHDDFINARSAPVPVKAAVVKFVRAVAGTYDAATPDDDILKAHFVEPSYNEFKKQQAAFLNGSSAKISIQNSHSASIINVANSDDVKTVIDSVRASMPSMTPEEAALLITSQARLDALTRPAVVYGSGGIKRKISIFSKNTDGSQESGQVSENAPTTPSINNRK